MFTPTTPVVLLVLYVSPLYEGHAPILVSAAASELQMFPPPPPHCLVNGKGASWLQVQDHNYS